MKVPEMYSIVKIVRPPFRGPVERNLLAIVPKTEALGVLNVYQELEPGSTFISLPLSTEVKTKHRNIERRMRRDMKRSKTQAASA